MCPNSPWRPSHSLSVEFSSPTSHLIPHAECWSWRKFWGLVGGGSNGLFGHSCSSQSSVCGKHGAVPFSILSGHSGLLCVCHQMCAWLRDWSCSGHLAGWTTWNCQHLLISDLQKCKLMWFKLPVSAVPLGSCQRPRSYGLEVFLSFYLSWSSSPNFLECHFPVTQFCAQRHEWGSGRALGWESADPSSPCRPPQRLPCLQTSADTCALPPTGLSPEEFVHLLHLATTCDLSFKTTPRSLPWASGLC